MFSLTSKKKSVEEGPSPAPSSDHSPVLSFPSLHALVLLLSSYFGLSFRSLLIFLFAQVMEPRRNKSDRLAKSHGARSQVEDSTGEESGTPPFILAFLILQYRSFSPYLTYTVYVTRL